MFLILFLFAIALSAQTADMIVTNATIYTVDAAQPKALALAVKDGKFLAVGDDVSEHRGPKTKVIDAGGSTIVPGLIDSHAHMAGLGQSLEILNLRHAKSAHEIVEMVRAKAAETPKGQWILGRSWDHTRWPGQQFPNADQLSAVTPDHPVYLTRVDGHAGWANRKALEIAGVTAETKDPPGGKIHKAADGRPTGILIDRAQGMVRSKVPSATPAQVKERLARAAQECARLGMTGVHDAGVSRTVIAAYKELIAEKRLPVRIYAMIGGEGELWKEYLKRGPEIGDYLTVRSIKLMGDGALGSRGAAMKEPYDDDPHNHGLLITEPETLERVARAAVKHGFQVNTHAIGDRANHEVLVAYGKALGGENDRRFRIEHAQIVDPDDFELFEKYSVLPSMQATHATSDMRWVAKRIGDERTRGSYAWRRFLSMGLPIPNGSDFPVEDANPLWGFYASITRQDHEGSPEGGWMPDHRMTRAEALESWTLSGAFASFDENRKGSITPGKLADFIVLSRDIMKVEPKEILDTRVTMTVLGGEIVYAEKN
jgi:predicted amidohydrolase YtcJ